MNFLKWQVGKVTITCVAEVAGGSAPGTFLFAEATSEYVLRHPWLQPHFRSDCQHAVITGGVMHHPIQCCEPDLSCRFDVSRAAAASTRRAFVAAQADKPVLIIGTHFAAPTGGWIRADGDVWRFTA